MERYIKPEVEVCEYRAERGFAFSVALDRDYVLIEGEDRETLRASDEVTEYTDAGGSYNSGEWL